jgi:long-chain fatty acid transport protein
MRTIRTIGTLIILTFTALSAHASNYADNFGGSPMGLALGNAMTARVNDWSSTYYNISGLGKSVDFPDVVSDNKKEYKNQFAIAYTWNKPEVDIDIRRTNSQTGELLATNGASGLETGALLIGATLDLALFYDDPKYISTGRLGLLVSLNDDLALVKINDISLQTHNFFRYGRETRALMVLIGAGFGFMDDLIGFGVGLSPSLGGEGKILATNLTLTTEPQSPTMQANFDFTVNAMRLVIGGYLKPGRIFPILEGVDLGISYREENYLYVDDFQMGTQVAVGNIDLQILAAMFDFYQPPITRIGASYSTDAFILSGDLEYREWSQNKMSKMQKTAYKDQNGEIIKVPELDDVIVPRAGLQINLSETTALLMGYYYEQTCVPNSATKGIFNILDNDKHVGSCGIKFRVPKVYSVPYLGWLLDGIGPALKGPLDITASYQYQHLMERDVKKTNPTPENPNYSYGGNCHTAMLGFELNL